METIFHSVEIPKTDIPYSEVGIIFLVIGDPGITFL